MILKYIKKLEELIVVFTIFFMPLIFTPFADNPFWGGEEIFFKSSLYLLLIISLILSFFKKQIVFIKTPFNKIFFIFLIISMIGVIKVVNIYMFFNKIIINILFFVLYIASLKILIEKNNLNKIFLIILFSSFIMSLYGVLQVLGIDFLPWESNFSKRAYSTLGNPNFLGGHLLLIIPLTYGLFLENIRKTLWKYLFLLSIFFTITLFLTQTRGAYLGFLVSLILFLILSIFFEKEKVKKYKNIIIIFLLTIFALSSGYIIKNKQALKRIRDIILLKDESYKIRLSLWKNTLYLIKDNIILGTGAGNFPIKYSYYQYASLSPSYYKKSDFYKSSHAHNDYLQFLAEYGILGGGVIFYLFFFIFYFGVKSLKILNENKFIMIGILSGIGGLLVHAMFNFPFLIIPTVGIFFVFLAILIFLTEKYSIKIKTIKKEFIIFLLVILFIFNIIPIKNLIGLTYLRNAKRNEFFNKLNDALYYAKKSYQIFPLNIDVGKYYALISYKTGYMDNAKNVLEKLYRLNPGDWEINVMLFENYINSNEKEKSLKIAKNMFDISPYSNKSIKSLGYAYYINEKYKDALNIYKKGVNYFPDDYNLLNQIAVIYGVLNDFNNSIKYSQRAISLKPDYIDAYYNIAVSYYKMKNYVKAKDYIIKILNIDSQNKMALHLLSVIKNEKRN